MSTITEQDIKALTPEHRIVWHSPPGQPVEMGLYADGVVLYTDVGDALCYKNGTVPSLVRSRIVRIIPPAFVPRDGMVIGKPYYGYKRMVRIEGDWLGDATELGADAGWFTDTDARDLIENHGWATSTPGDYVQNAAEFDRWLAEVKAEAWDEGYKNGYRDRGREASYEPGTNPYREGGA